MSSYTIGYDEGYKCPCCNKFFNDVDLLVCNSWKCPYCKEYIHIAAPDLQNGHVLIRKPVSELRKYDSVHISGQFVYDVINIQNEGHNKIRVALKNYRSSIFNCTDFVSVITGGYYEDDWIDNSSDPCQ